MYSAQGDDGQGDFAAVTVKEGHLEFRFDTGSGEFIKSGHKCPFFCSLTLKKIYITISEF